MNFSSLCEAASRLDPYGYVVSPRGKIYPISVGTVPEFGDSHVGWMISNYDLLPKATQGQIDMARSIGDDEEAVFDILYNDCNYMYETMLTAGWLFSASSEAGVLHVLVNNFSEKTKRKIADFIVDLGEGAWVRRLQINGLKAGVLHSFKTCRDFLRGEE